MRDLLSQDEKHRSGTIRTWESINLPGVMLSTDARMNCFFITIVEGIVFWCFLSSTVCGDLNPTEGKLRSRENSQESTYTISQSKNQRFTEFHSLESVSTLFPKQGKWRQMMRRDRVMRFVLDLAPTPGGIVASWFRTHIKRGGVHFGPTWFVRFDLTTWEFFGDVIELIIVSNPTTLS